MTDIGANIIQAFPDYHYIDGKNIMRGVDVSRGGYVYGEPGIYEKVGLLDSASHHPTSAIVMNAFGEYTKNFKDLLDARIAIKHRDFDTARKMLDGKLAPYLDNPADAEDLAQALKIAINSVYGLTSANFPNAFKDSRNENNFIACRGAIFMKLLQDEVEAKGYKVPSVRTDSLKIVGVDDDIIRFVMDFGKKYGYTFEHEATYDRMCLTTKADYIAKYDEYGIRNKGGKHAGAWTSTGAYWSRPYVFKTLFSHEELTFDNLCIACEVKSQDGMWLDMNEGLPSDAEWVKALNKIENDDGIQFGAEAEAKRLHDLIDSVHVYRHIGKVGLFVPIKEGANGGELLVKRNNKYDAVAGTKGYRWLEAEQVKLMSKEDDIDMEYFHSLANAAIALLSEYGDFEWFTRD